MNGPARDATALRAEVRAALDGDGLEPVVRDLLELRFPREGPGASLDATGRALGMSPALVSHIEFGALCAIAARRSHRRALTTTRGGRATGARRLQDGGQRR
jgi:hypothetical protein